MYRENKKDLCLFLVGPTASGKTRLALELAEHYNAEIISADSRQAFRGMDIGTATPSPAELSRVKHYFVNDRDPDAYFSAGEFGRRALCIIGTKMRDHENILICGGSGLYIQAVLGMTGDTEKSDEHIRGKIRERAEKEGWPALYRELQERDPQHAAAIDADNPQRICRALEILETAGTKPSEVLKGGEAHFPYPYLMIGLRPQRELLYRRIDRRTEEMLRAGLVREVRELLQKGYTAELNALNTVGYKEIIAYLKGEISLENAVREIQKNTRRYAKRQMTWFRKFAPHYWIDIGGNTAFRDIFSEALHRIDTFMRTPPAR